MFHNQTVPYDSGEPSELLEPDWCQEIGSTSRVLNDVVNKQDESVSQTISQGIYRVNERMSNELNELHHEIKTWSILPYHDAYGKELSLLKIHNYIALRFLFQRNLNLFNSNYFYWFMILYDTSNLDISFDFLSKR